MSVCWAQSTLFAEKLEWGYVIIDVPWWVMIAGGLALVAVALSVVLLFVRRAHR